MTSLFRNSLLTIAAVVFSSPTVQANVPIANDFNKVLERLHGHPQALFQPDQIHVKFYEIYVRMLQNETRRDLPEEDLAKILKEAFLTTLSEYKDEKTGELVLRFVELFLDKVHFILACSVPQEQFGRHRNRYEEEFETIKNFLVSQHDLFGQDRLTIALGMVLNQQIGYPVPTSSDFLLGESMPSAQDKNHPFLINVRSKAEAYSLLLKISSEPVYSHPVGLYEMLIASLKPIDASEVAMGKIVTNFLSAFKGFSFQFLLADYYEKGPGEAQKKYQEAVKFIPQFVAAIVPNPLEQNAILDRLSQNAARRSPQDEKKSD